MRTGGAWLTALPASWQRLVVAGSGGFRSTPRLRRPRASMARVPPLEPLQGRSLPELREMLCRQERLLRDRKFICRLPDKGKKISDFAEKLRIVIAQEEELKRTTKLLSAVKLEFEGKQEAVESKKWNAIVNSDQSPCEDSSLCVPCSAHNISNDVQPALHSKQNLWTGKRSTTNEMEGVQQILEDSSIPQGSKTVLEASAARLPGDAAKDPEHNSLGRTENPALSASVNSEALIGAFASISLGQRECEENTDGLDANCESNLFLNLPDKIPQASHYTEVVEHKEKNPVLKRSKFKTNVPAVKRSVSPRGSPDIPLPGASSSSMSSEERRRRDKKHLDDITAARSRPLLHEPARLLSIEESVMIQIQQKAAYEELQARFAAQKLAERLGIKMAHYEPEGEMTSFREVRDEDGYSSPED